MRTDQTLRRRHQMAAKEIYLVRHAEAVYESRIPDAARPLSARGVHQANALVTHLEHLGIEEIHSSPYERCVDTIAPLAEKLRLEPRIVQELRERAFTRSHIADWASVWRTAWIDPDFAFHDGESGRQAQQRMYEAVTRLVATSPARKLAVSSHGNVIALLLQRIDSRFGFEHACAIRNPDILRLTVDGNSLLWDADFAIVGLDAFATTFESRASES